MPEIVTQSPTTQSDATGGAAASLQDDILAALGGSDAAAPEARVITEDTKATADEPAEQDAESEQKAEQKAKTKPDKPEAKPKDKADKPEDEGRPEAARRIAEKERKRATEEKERARRYMEEGEKIRDSLRAEADAIKTELATREKQLVEMNSNFEAALRDPEKLLRLAAQASGRTQREVVQAWVNALTTGEKDAPAQPKQIPELDEIRKIKEEIVKEREAAALERQKIQQREAEVSYKSMIAAEFDKLDSDEEFTFLPAYNKSAVVNRAYELIAEEYKRSKKELDLRDVFRTLESKLSEDEAFYQKARSRRGTAGQASSTSGQTERDAPKKGPTTTLASVSGGNGSPKRSYTSQDLQDELVKALSG